MKKVGKVFSKVLQEWLDVYEVNSEKIVCVCGDEFTCRIHKK